jgi:ATP phosphoribosyltransferase
MLPSDEHDILRLALPKGRQQDGVALLLQEAGIDLLAGERNYRPALSIPGYEVKLLKPQNIVEMLHAGSRDLGFAGKDWVAEHQVELLELLDTGLNPVRLVAAAPEDILEDGKLPARPLVVASEYERLTRQWMERRGMGDTFVHSHGATEVFPPEDASLIVDNTATGSTLQANDLAIVDELMCSSTCLYAHPKVMDVPQKRDRIESLVLLLQSVLDARGKLLLEVNVSQENLDHLLELLPFMRAPTISPLQGGGAFAVRVAVPRGDLPALIPQVKQRGGTDLIVMRPAQIVP